MATPQYACQLCKFWDPQTTPFKMNPKGLGNEPVLVPENSKPSRQWGLCRANAPIKSVANGSCFALTHQNDWCGAWVAIT